MLMSPSRLKKFGYTGVGLFILGVVFQFLIAPTVVNHLLKWKISLKKGWPMRDIWSKLPFVIESRIYIFNVTNPIEIGNGAKPIVREIGPFVYDIQQEKTYQIDHEDDDSVSYILKNTYTFNKIKSMGLSDEVEVYFPHTYIMTAANGILKHQPVLASYTSRAVDSVLGNPDSLFYKVKARTLLFDGFTIPCEGVNDYFGKLMCNFLNEQWFNFTVRKRGNTYYTSMFGFVNGTYEKQKRIRIKRGVKKLNDVGKIIELDGHNNINIWKDDKCDEFKGTDATIFPPINDRKDIVVVMPLLCRKIRLSYESKVRFSGLNLLRYTGDLGTDGDHVVEDKCYCISTDSCLRKGMFELFRCFNVPIIASNPHFYKADPYYLTRVDTLRPDKEKHQLVVDFDELTGQPVTAHLRAQFNMELLAIQRFRFMRNYSYAMLPMVWMDESFVLPDFLLNEIRISHKILTIVKVLNYTFMLCGMAMCIVAGYHHYRSRKVTKLAMKASAATPSTNSNNSDKVIVSGLSPAPLPLEVD